MSVSATGRSAFVLRNPATPDRIQGVDLKQAEAVVRQLLLSSGTLRYSLYPPLPTGIPSALAEFLTAEDPFATLPRSVDPASRGRVELSGFEFGVPTRRASRKRQQISCLVRGVAHVLAAAQRPGVIADMCGGCGHVGIVLASLLPEWEVVVVDAKKHALDVAVQRAKDAGLVNINVAEMDVARAVPPLLEYSIAVALHACGDASDVVIEGAFAAEAAIVVAPCCVGGVVSDRSRGVPGVAAPSSRWASPRGETISREADPEDYRLLARAADYSEDVARGDPWRRSAKGYIEWDRLEWIVEHGYHAHLVKMIPLECTPKNDVIVACPIAWNFADDWEEDVETNNAVVSCIGENGIIQGFDSATVAEVRGKLVAGVDQSDFGMVKIGEDEGPKYRKVVHAVAEALGMYHSSHGEGAKRHVVVKRTEAWPFIIHGYLRYAGRWVVETAESLVARVPPECVSQRISKRGSGVHLTVVSPPEQRRLGRLGEECLKALAVLERTSEPSLVGLGRLTDPSDAENEVYYAVVKWPEAQEFRGNLGLPSYDFHITLGFTYCDVFNVPKDASTLLPDP